MSFMRGEYYTWHDDKNIYFNNTAYPLEIFDALVLMRMAEIIDDPKALDEAVKTALEQQGNFGCDALCELLDKKTTVDLLNEFAQVIKERKKDNGT